MTHRQRQRQTDSCIELRYAQLIKYLCIELRDAHLVRRQNDWNLEAAGVVILYSPAAAADEDGAAGVVRAGRRPLLVADGGEPPQLVPILDGGADQAEQHRSPVFQPVAWNPKLGNSLHYYLTQTPQT